MNQMIANQRERIREILFRKFIVRKYPNHRKYVPHHRHITMDYFEPHKKLIREMQKQNRLHQELTDKHEKRIKVNKKITHMPSVRLARLEKKWYSLSKGLRKSLGV